MRSTAAIQVSGLGTTAPPMTRLEAKCQSDTGRPSKSFQTKVYNLKQPARKVNMFVKNVCWRPLTIVSILQQGHSGWLFDLACPASGRD